MLRPRPTNLDGTRILATPESRRLKMKLARRSVALARSVEPHPHIGALMIYLTNGERLVLFDRTFSGSRKALRQSS